MHQARACSFFPHRHNDNYEKPTFLKFPMNLFFVFRSRIQLEIDITNK